MIEIFYLSQSRRDAEEALLRRGDSAKSNPKGAQASAMIHAI